MNIIGDIAGQYDALVELLKKMPDDEPVSLGDMNDRGPDSKEVFDLFKDNGRAVLGNHEHMMLDFLTEGKYYDQGLWLNWNGGSPTMHSFGYSAEEYIDYLKSLPLFIDEDNYLLTHAPINPAVSWEMFLDYGSSSMDKRCPHSVLWNRGKPRKIKDKTQIHGHNASRNVVEFKNKGDPSPYAYCIDTSMARKLTGYSTVTKKFYEQEYIEKVI